MDTPDSNNGQLAMIEVFIGAAKQRTQKSHMIRSAVLRQSEEYRGACDDEAQGIRDDKFREMGFA